jgi:signal transduction histidine kinase
VPAAAELSAYRLVQESLSNAARHAPGAPVHLVLRRTENELFVRVRNGPGAAGPADRPGEPGQGIRGMRERVTMLGGELSALPTGEGGFEVRATLPLGEPK